MWWPKGEDKGEAKGEAKGETKSGGQRRARLVTHAAM